MLRTYISIKIHYKHLFRKDLFNDAVKSKQVQLSQPCLTKCQEYSSVLKHGQLMDHKSNDAIATTQNSSLPKRVTTEEEEEPPSVEKLRNMYMGIARNYEKLWDSDRRAGYPGFIDVPDTPLGMLKKYLSN